jgi:hypothetical protein
MEAFPLSLEECFSLLQSRVAADASDANVATCACAVVVDNAILFGAEHTLTRNSDVKRLCGDQVLGHDAIDGGVGHVCNRIAALDAGQ